MPNRYERSRRGATLVLMAVMIPVSLMIAAYCINVAYMELTRTELQVATDVATRAGGRVLAISGDRDEAAIMADRLLALNPTTIGHAIPLASLDIQFGVSTRNAENQRYVFRNGTDVNALRLETNGTLQPPMLFPTLGVPIEFRPMKTAISTQTELDIVLVLDRSGSMAFADNENSDASIPAAAPSGWKFGDAVPAPSRWVDTLAAVDDFFDLMERSSHDERIGLVTYSSQSSNDTDLVTDLNQVELQLQGYSQRFKGGATNIGGGILAGIKTLSDKKHARPWASRVMILLSDGRHNTGSDPLAAAHAAAQEMITIYTVTFSNEADVGLMQQIAANTSGLHFHTVDGDELAAAFEAIARSLPTLITY